MAEDIQIGADTSDAVANIGAIGKAFEQAARAAQISSKEMNAAIRQQERANGALLGAIARANSSRKGELTTISELITAEQKLAAAKRATANTGVTVNSRGQGISASSGQFVGAAQTQAYQKQVALAERLVGREADLARQRERSARQQQLEAVFAKQFYGVADQGAGPLRRVANLLTQIPPATWGQKLGQATGSIMNMSNSTRYAMYDVANSFGIAGAAILAFGAVGYQAAISHERAFANVRRTTQTTADGYEVLRLQLERMAATMPVAFDEITAIASAAGQLGISAGGVAQFTQTVAKLSATTNLTADAAGTALARFRAFFAESAASKGLNVTEATFSNLASSILKVGVNSIATETGIVNVATQIASMGSYAGLTANQVIGLAGALSSIGVAPELARGTITRTFSMIGTAVSEGGIQLDKFAKLAGMSAQQFKASWGTDTFAGTFQAMLQGLYGVTQSGQDANLMLMELGFNSVRDRPLLLRLAGAADETGKAGGLLAQTLADAYDGWVQNSELASQYSKISETTAARLQTLTHAFEALFASMGQQSGGFLGDAAAGLTQFINGLTELSRSPGGQILGTIALNGALVAGALMLVVAAGARTVASLQGIGTAWKAMTATAVGGLRSVSMAFKIANLSLGLIGIVASVAAVVAGFAMMDAEARKARRGVQDLDGLLAAMTKDGQGAANTFEFYVGGMTDVSDEARDTAAATSLMNKALDVSDGANAGADSLQNFYKATKVAKLGVGDATKAFVKSQLAADEGFRDLFNVSKKRGGFLGLEGNFSLEDLGIDPKKLNWDKFLEDSFKGGIDKQKLRKQLADIADVNLNPTNGIEQSRLDAINSYVDDISDKYGNLTPEVRALYDANQALNGTLDPSAKALRDMAIGAVDAATGMSDLDEATRKAVESVASGLVKFVDTSSLIKLTQQSKGDAKEFEKAWADAYGGAAFKLEDYLSVFRRAAEEQSKFTTNLSQLSARGLSEGIIQELSAMGPEAAKLVQALVDGTDAQLQEYEALWGQTGYESMVQFAAQSRIAQEQVNAVMAIGGLEAVKTFSAALATGAGIDEALAKVQQKFNADPLDPKANAPVIPNLSQSTKAFWEQQNSLNILARVRISPTGKSLKVMGHGSITVDAGYADGGWTGPGSRLTPKGQVHADEFVFTKKATNSIGVRNLYAMMAQAERGRPAPRGRGYAAGGRVGGGTPMEFGMASIVALSPEDRDLLRRGLQPTLRIGNRDVSQAQSDANFVTKRQGVG